MRGSKQTVLGGADAGIATESLARQAGARLSPGALAHDVPPSAEDLQLDLLLVLGLAESAWRCGDVAECADRLSDADGEP